MAHISYTISITFKDDRYERTRVHFQNLFHLLDIAPLHAAMNSGVDVSITFRKLLHVNCWMLSILQSNSIFGHAASSRCTASFTK